MKKTMIMLIITLSTQFAFAQPIKEKKQDQKLAKEEKDLSEIERMETEGKLLQALYAMIAELREETDITFAKEHRRLAGLDHHMMVNARHQEFVVRQIDQLEAELNSFSSVDDAEKSFFKKYDDIKDQLKKLN